MLKRAGHAVHTSVLAGQRAAARAGVPAGGLRGTYTFINRLRDMISKLRARLTTRVSMSSTRHIRTCRADDWRRQPRVREVFL